MFVHDLFLDPTLRLLCNAEGDNPPEGGAASDPPNPPGDTPPPKDAAGDAPKGDEPPLDPEAARSAGWTKDALEKQLAKQHRKMKEYEAQVAEMAEIKAENLRLQELARAATSRTAGSPPDAGDRPPSPPPPPTPPVAQDRNAIREEERFNLRVEALTKQIKANYEADWPVASENFTKVLGNDLSTLRDLTSQVLATKDPAYVMVTLGKNPGKLQDVLEIADRDERAEALREMAMEKAAKTAEPPKRPSGAPPPPSGDYQRGGAPPSGSGVNLYDERFEFKNYAGNLDAEREADAAWSAERDRVKRESKGRAWSIGR